MARIAVVSFRLGGTDGVSIEATKWIWALRQLGHHVTTVAGEGPVDHLIAELAINATERPSLDELATTLRDADLVIVENLVSLPLNLGARDVLYEVLDGRDALFRHHDLAWQRDGVPQLVPLDRPGWRHVTINDLSRDELAERGISATTMRNTFECDPPPGCRDSTRRRLDLRERPLLLMASRAIARKNVEGALALAASMDAVLWTLGPAEDGYGPQFNELLTHYDVDIRRGLSDELTIDDAYAASDLVVMASTWEGFGNPVLESVTHRRPLAVYPYPVLDEIKAFGFHFFDLGDVTSILHFLASPDEALLDANLALAREHFNLADLPQLLENLLILDESTLRETHNAARET
jgi:glycosyltransferase involved in cell wall biosynthesis